MVYKVERIPNSWEYDIPNYPNATFEECTVGNEKGKTFIISGNKVAEVKVLESHFVRNPFNKICIVDKVEIIRENLNFKDIFLSVARKTTFVIEDGVPYEGFTFNQYWNGWEMPMFEKEVATQMMNDFNKEADCIQLTYDKEQDAFVYHSEFDEPYEEKGHNILGDDGQTHHVYDIGAGSWIWSEYQEYINE